MNPLLTIVRLKPVETQLKRIADGIEAHLRLAYNYNLSAPKPMEDSGREPESLEYSDDEKTTLVEAKEFIDSLRIKPVEDE